MNYSVQLCGKKITCKILTMKLILTLAWRNLWRNKRRTLITISSVLFAVILAVFFFSMERGSYERMIDTMVRYSTGYIQVQDVKYDEEPSMDYAMFFDEDIKDLLKEFDDEISYHVPRIESFALAAADEVTRGSMVRGIDPGLENKMSELADDLVEGEFIERGDEGLLIAEGFAGILNVTIGDTLILLGQGFQGVSASGLYPIKGIVELSLPEMNNNTIYMSLDAAQWFYAAENRLTSLIIMPENPSRTDQLAEKLNSKIDSEWYNVLTWEEMLTDLLAMMQFDMAGTWVLMIILYIVISFGLFGTILTMMIERRREFRLLFSLGLKRSKLAAVCFLESVFITFTGAISGMILAFPVVLYFYHNPIPLTGGMAETIMDYGFEPVLPFSLAPSVFYSQALIVLIISFLVGLFPVYKVFKFKITDQKT